MTRALIAAGAFAAVLVLVVLLLFVAGRRAPEQAAEPAATTPRASEPAAAAAMDAPPAPSTPAAAVGRQGFLHGRVTTLAGATYEGRLRWGGDEEAFWGDYFNGTKDENRWAAHVPPERLPTVSRPLEIFGIEILRRERRIDLERPFMLRFGDITRIDARALDLRVTTKSGTVFTLDRLEADDFADGVRVWDHRHGVVDLGERGIRTIELFPAPRPPAEPATGSAAGPSARPVAAPARLHGTVRTREGDFTGFVQWDREACTGDDELRGGTADGELALPFGAIRSISRRSGESCVVTLLDGREIVLSGTREAGDGHRGTYVDDRRYGRVLVSWDAFERIDLTPGGGGPAYDDYPPGHTLSGAVTTRSGRRLAGRLVFDLDESETTETLDAPAGGVDYTIPFGLVASIAPTAPAEGGAGHARVTLHGGEELALERAGDLGEENAGMLVFVEGREQPEYVPWAEVARVDLHRPPAMYPPLADG